MNGGPLRIDARREISVMGWSKGRGSKERVALLGSYARAVLDLTAIGDRRRCDDGPEDKRRN
jgi:hypothetical protein